MLEVVTLQLHCAERGPPQAVQLQRLQLALCIQHLPVLTTQGSAICELFIALVSCSAWSHSTFCQVAAYKFLEQIPQRRLILCQHQSVSRQLTLLHDSPGLSKLESHSPGSSI